MVKSGLLPNGLNITYNKSGYHVSTMVKVKVASNLSPWFSNVEVGEEMILPISTKEGRVVGSEKLIDELIGKGQILPICRLQSNRLNGRYRVYH